MMKKKVGRSMNKVKIDQISEIQELFPQYEVIGKLYGGSAAKLYILRQGTKEFVLKIANEKGIDNGTEKLKHEIAFLEKMGTQKETNFSQVLEKHIDENLVWYLMPYYKNFCLLRDFLLQKEPFVCQRVLENLSQKVFQHFYSLEKRNAESDFLLVRNINRVKTRLEQSMEMPDEIKQILEQEYVVINGKQYENYNLIFEKILNRPKMQQRLSPIYSSLTHDDFTIENVLISQVDETDFIIIDPRGTKDTGNYRDYIYDLAKFTCTLNGFTTIKYDEFELSQTGDGYKLVNDSPSQQIYDTYYESVFPMFGKQIMKYYKEDEDWLIRLKFTQSCHYLADIPCRLFNGDSIEKAIAIYLKGLVLLNECLDEMASN